MYLNVTERYFKAVLSLFKIHHGECLLFVFEFVELCNYYLYIQKLLFSIIIVHHYVNAKLNF